MENMIRISRREQGSVFFAPAFGGFGKFASEQEFANYFEQLDEATVNKLFDTFFPVEVTALEGDGSMTGFTNNETWNGFEVPRFTTEAVRQALAEGGHLANPSFAEYTRFHFDANTETLFDIEAANGLPIPDDFDIAPFLQLLEQERTFDEVDEAAQKMGYTMRAADKVMVKIDGENEPVVLHEVGNGWCWENMDRFRNAPRRHAPGM